MSFFKMKVQQLSKLLFEIKNYGSSENITYRHLKTKSTYERLLVEVYLLVSMFTIGMKKDSTSLFYKLRLFILCVHFCMIFSICLGLLSSSIEKRPIEMSIRPHVAKKEEFLKLSTAR